MYYCTCDCMSMCDYMLMYVLYVSVFVCCPIYCAGCLMRDWGMLTQWPAPETMG